MRQKILRVALVACVLAGLAIIGSVAYAIWRSVHVRMPDAYALQSAANLIIEHLDRHQGTWPRSWEDLHGTLEVAHTGILSTNPAAEIEELRRRVEIDWSADAGLLQRIQPTTSQPPFRVIWLRDGDRTHFSGMEPNQMIYDYLHRAVERAPR